MKNKLIRLAWIPVALSLSACDVQVTDTTPDQFQANNDIGMYEVTATTKEGALVTPGSVVLFAIGGPKKEQLSVNADGSGYHGLYRARCEGSFPLQIQAVWRLQGLSTRSIVVPAAKPRQIKLTEPPLAQTAGFDTAAKPAAAKGKGGKGEWTGSVDYRFVTVPVTQITSARIESSSGSAEDVAAARAISVKTTLPLQAACGEPVKVELASSAQRSHGTLVIDTDNPGVSRWQTYVEFSPK